MTVGSSHAQTEDLFNGKDLSNWNFVVADGNTPAEDVFSVQDMLRAARSLKLKARAATVNSKKLTKLSLPLIVGMKDEKFAVLAQIADDVMAAQLTDTKNDSRRKVKGSGRNINSKFLILPPNGGPPQVMSAEDFQDEWTGRVVLFTQRFWKEADRKS